MGSHPCHQHIGTYGGGMPGVDHRHTACGTFSGPLAHKETQASKEPLESKGLKEGATTPTPQHTSPHSHGVTHTFMLMHVHPHARTHYPHSPLTQTHTFSSHLGCLHAQSSNAHTDMCAHTESHSSANTHAPHVYTHAYAHTLMHVQRALTSMHMHTHTAISTEIHPFTYT